jgi:hypothetical protein
VLDQVDQVVQPEIVPVVSVDLARVDQVVQVEIVPAALADNVQVEIVLVVSVDLVQQVLVVASLVPAHQVALQVEHQAAGQVGDQTQQVVAVTQQAHSENLAADLRRVVSQSVQSVKSSTT